MQGDYTYCKHYGHDWIIDSKHIEMDMIIEEKHCVICGKKRQVFTWYEEEEDEKE